MKAVPVIIAAIAARLAVSGTFTTCCSTNKGFLNSSSFIIGSLSYSIVALFSTNFLVPVTFTSYVSSSV